MKKKISIILSILGVILLTCLIIFTAYFVRFYVPKKYSRVIPTKNIASIEYKINNVTAVSYNPENYRTLTSEETENFKKNITSSNYKFTYARGLIKGIKKLTFVINYNDGSKIIFCNAYFTKYDKNGNVVYDKILIHYHCEINDSLFK